MRRALIYLVVLAGVSGLGWWAWGLHRGAPSALEIAPAGAAARSPGLPQDGPPATPAPATGTPAGTRGAVGVEAARAERVSISETVSAVGTLRANESVVIKPEIAGRIERIHFEGGARVRKGALLVSLDASVAAAEADQIRAELGLAQANYQRTADLARQRFVSDRALDEAAANLKVLEARLKLAEARLAKTRLVAPFAGVLGLRNVSTGDFVREGAELVALEDVSRMKVDLRLPERYFGQLRPGQRLQAGFDAYPGRRFEAVLEAIDVQVDANGRSLVARGRLSNDEGLLRSGMFAKVALELAQRDDAVLIPEEAVFPAGDEQFVFLIDDGKATRVRVRTGVRRDGKVEIVEGVRGGDLVVTAGQPKIARDGTEVRIVVPPPAQGS